MNNSSYDILNDISEGIMILNEKSEVSFWNHYMENVTGISSSAVAGRPVWDVLPGFATPYYKKSIDTVMKNGFKMFFSAAMHSDLILAKGKYNIKISRFEKESERFLLFEFIDVTNQFEQISRLKNYVQELYEANAELKAKEQTIKKLAYFDNLTGLANRTLFYRISERFLNTAKRRNHLMGLMFIDVDKLKNVNDSLGHEAGDQLLVFAAIMLKEACGRSDLVVRLGGDEFLIMLPNMKRLDAYRSILSHIEQSQNKTLCYKGHEINLSFSIGISMYPYDGDSMDALLTAADKAMYVAKNNGNPADYYALSPELAAALASEKK